VARREIMATLAGRRTDQIGRKRRVASVCWGAALIGAGLLFQHFGTGATGAAPLPLVGGTSLPVVGGIALVEVGAIMCTSSIVAAVASLGRLLPLGPRLALRESARHSGRTTPAVAAMFAAVAGAVAAGAWLDSSAAQQRAQYTPLLLPNQVAIQTDPATAAKIVSALKPLLPNMTGTLVTESVAGYQQSINASPLWTVDAFAPGSGAPACAADGVTKVAVADLGNTSCGNYISPTAGEGELIGGPQVFQTVTGIDDAAATRVLEQGGIVVTDPSLVHDGTTSVVVQCAVYAPHAAEATQTTLTLTLPAVYVDAHGKPDPGFVVSPAAADRLGLAVPAGQQTTLVIDLSQPVTARQMYLSNELVQHQFDGSLQVDYGPSDTRDLANLAVLGFTILLAICAAAIATGLALADGRADQETLTAVGGSPWTRRWLAGSTALVITGLGVLIGVPVGFVIAGGLVDVSNVNLEGQSMPFTVPWLNLGAMVLAVPLLTAAGAMALSRTKAPAIRRLG
jgi:putative ABC transport system permease protein